MTDISPGYGIIGPTAPSGSQGSLTRAAPKWGNSDVPHFETTFLSLAWCLHCPLANAWQAQLGFAESLDPVFKRRSEGGTC